MSIHREGYKILASVFSILLILNVIIGIIWPGDMLLRYSFLVISFFFFLFVLFFFRLPERDIILDNGAVFAPADGKVVVVEETFEKEYFKDDRLQVSIFMSAFNMHSNRYPVSGTVKYVKYHSGNYIVARHPKSSDLNERSTIVIETETGEEILIRQIAGFVARRVVTYAKEDQHVTQGDELGFIKFGSRVDILLPRESKVEVPVLQKVRANRSIIARI